MTTVKGELEKIHLQIVEQGQSIGGGYFLRKLNQLAERLAAAGVLNNIIPEENLEKFEKKVGVYCFGSNDDDGDDVNALDDTFWDILVALDAVPTSPVQQSPGEIFIPFIPSFVFPNSIYVYGVTLSDEGIISLYGYEDNDDNENLRCVTVTSKNNEPEVIQITRCIAHGSDGWLTRPQERQYDALDDVEKVLYDNRFTLIEKENQRRALSEQTAQSLPSQSSTSSDAQGNYSTSHLFQPQPLRRQPVENENFRTQERLALPQLRNNPINYAYAIRVINADQIVLFGLAGDNAEARRWVILQQDGYVGIDDSQQPLIKKSILCTQLNGRPENGGQVAKELYDNRDAIIEKVKVDNPDVDLELLDRYKTSSYRFASIQ